MPQISGTIFDDLNGNGKQDAGEPGQPRQVNLDRFINGQRVETQTVMSGSDGSFTFGQLPDNSTWYVYRPSYPAGYKCSTDGGLGYQAVNFMAGETGNVVVNIGSTAVAAPAPVLKVGGAVALPSEVPLGALPTIQKLKLPAIRCFSDPWGTANIGTNGFKAMSPLMAQNVIYVAMFGCAQGSSSLPSLATVEADLKLLNPLFAANPNAIFEHQNELNLQKYLPAGQSATTPDAKTVAWIMTVIQAAHSILPPSTQLYSPSVGWDAGPQPHIDWLTALVNAGMLKYVTALNTHLYFTDPTQVDTLLSALRKLVGPDFPIVLTECNFDVPIAQYPATAAKILPVIAKYNVEPFVYRYCPTGSSEFDALDLIDARGNINSPVATAWGLA